VLVKDEAIIKRPRRTLVVLLLLTVAPFAATCPRGGDSSNTALEEKNRIAANNNRPPGSGEPVLPSVFLDTTYARPSGKTITVRNGGDFQAALDAASPGDQIVLEAGAEFQGNFRLPRKEGKSDRWIVIRSSATDSSLPQGKRVSPLQKELMPKLLSPNSSPVIKTAPAANHFRFIGIEFSIAPSVKRMSAIISLGDDRQSSLDSIPHDLIFDRCFIHGTPSATVRRGFALNSARTSVIDSYVSDCHEVGADSQAICGWAGPGPYKIVNNYLEGAGENLMFGGADAKIEGLVPSDIEIRRNHFSKPLSWMRGHPDYAGISWTVKNLLELKNARRALIDGNLFEYNWKAAQTGYAILFKSANSSGRATWSVTEDVTFTNNIVRHTAAAINILGRDYQDPSGQVKRILISNNLFYGIDKQKWGGDGAFLKITDTDFVTIDHNTVFQTGNIITAYGKPNSNFTFTNNLIQHNRYGVKGDSAAVGNETLERYFPGLVLKKNVIAGGRGSNYPADNHYPAASEVAVVNQAQGEIRLTDLPSSGKTGTDGNAIGCDLVALKRAGVQLQNAYGITEER
jgi:hypothetical protein